MSHWAARGALVSWISPGSRSWRRAAAVFASLGWIALVGCGPRAASAERDSSKKKSNASAHAEQSDPATDAILDEKHEIPEVVAVVNGKPIRRNDLATEAIEHYGAEVLDSLVNKLVISQACEENGFTVTRADVDAEIAKMAKRFNLSADQYLTMLKDERGIDPAQYASDIVWPTLGLRKLANTKLVVSEEEIDQAYEMSYGPAVQCRLIALNSHEKALEIRELAIADPESFGELAMEHSVDKYSASAKGLIGAIHKHSGDDKLEKLAFALREGDISEIIQVGNQWVFLRCESHIPSKKIERSKVVEELTHSIQQAKLQRQADEIFGELEKKANVERVFLDAEARARHPGVAALVDGHKLTIRELKEECIERHGKEILEGMIQRRLLEQTCQTNGIEVSQEELDAEVARGALAMGKTTDDDQPDVAAWLAEVTAEGGMTEETYMKSVVWPSAALRKLVEEGVEVTEDDLQKGFESSFGPRAKCLVIVLTQERQAQKVWELARSQPTRENFQHLARQYSVEEGSKALGGEVTPIRKHGGRPELEKEAFALKKGKISGIIQMEGSYVILYSDGMTKPIDVKYNEVKDQIETDLLEKKMRVAMATEFSKMQATAQIDNYLTGVSQSPPDEKAPEESGNEEETAARPRKKAR